jgi:hypothetical protein
MAEAQDTPKKPTENDTTTGEPAEACNDDFAARKDLDGKNDSGPDPEVHGESR